MTSRHHTPPKKKAPNAKNDGTAKVGESEEQPIYTADRLKQIAGRLKGLAADLEGTAKNMTGVPPVVLADKMLYRSLKHLARFCDNAELTVRKTNRGE